MGLIRFSGSFICVKYSVMHLVRNCDANESKKTFTETIRHLGMFQVAAVAPTCRCPVYPQIYPDEGHFLHSDGTQQHLSQSLVNFFGECFRLPEVAKDERKEDDENDS